MRAWVLYLAALPAIAQQGPCTAEGLVFREGDGAPVPQARIFFRTADPARPLVLGFFSGDDGRFRATGLEPVSYHLSVKKRGLLASGKGPASVNLSRDCHPAGLSIPLSPAAMITGRIGVPQGVSGAFVRVEAQKRAWVNGRWQHRAVAAASTNAAGEYRIVNLPAGSYIVRAFPAGPVSISMRGPSGPENFAAPSYYPGVLSSAQARPVTVEAGAEIPGLDFPILLTPLLRVSGRVLSAEGLKAPAWCSVSLRTIPPGAVYDARYQASDGTFVFTEIQPGEYELLAYSAESVNIGSISKRIQVGAGDLEGLELTLEPPLAVRFRASLPGTEVPSSGLTLRLRPLALRTVLEEDQTLAGDAPLTINAFVRDRYRIEFTSKQPGIYLKSVQAGGRALPSTVLDFSSAEAPREYTLLLGADGGRLEGFATGMAPQHTAYAVLIPADLSRLAGAALQTEQVSIDGRFAVESVPPGEYLVYVFSQPLGGGFDLRAMLQDPAWVPTYRGQPATVRVEPNRTAKVQVSVQPPP